MKNIKFLLVGMVFGIIMYKSQVVSWYRIHEMFRFESFHMYGIIGSAVGLGVIIIQLIKRFKMKSIEGQTIEIADKEKGFAHGKKHRYAWKTRILVAHKHHDGPVVATYDERRKPKYLRTVY